MRNYHAIIVDDQQSSIDILLEFFQKTEQVIIDKHFTDPYKALAYVRLHAVDLVIIDIDLNSRIDGFDWISSAPNNNIRYIVFTAYKSFEDQSYLMNAVDVLLKPVSFPRFAIAMNRLDEHIRLHESSGQVMESLDHYGDFLQVKDGNRFFKRMVWFREIIYIQSRGGYVFIYRTTDKEPLLSNSSLKTIEKMLPEQWFKKCRRNTIFNIKFFDSFDEKQVKLRVGGIQLPAGRLGRFKGFRDFVNSNTV